MTYELKHPFKSPETGVEIATVEMRRPRLGDLRTVRREFKDQEEAALALLARCCENLSPKECDALDLEDALALLTEVNKGAPSFQTAS